MKNTPLYINKLGFAGRKKLRSEEHERTIFLRKNINSLFTYCA